MEDSDGELVAHSNDAYFKKVFSDTGRAALFFQEHLPAPLVPHVDFASLRLVPGSFVKQSLQQAHSDLLFSVQIKGLPSFLYLLFEHQTTVDDRMPLRLLGYVLEILRTHAETHGLPLPPVLSLVLHQGPDRWTVSPCFEDLFALPESLTEVLMPYLPKFRHLLLDLSQCDPARDEKDAVIRVVLELMKQVRAKELFKFFVWLAGHELPPLDLLRFSLLYAWNAEPGLDLEQIAPNLEHNPKLREEIMSTATTLIAKGKAEGKARGLVEGRLTGLQDIMNLPISSEEELAGLEFEELERRYKALQQQYEKQYKLK